MVFVVNDTDYCALLELIFGKKKKQEREINRTKIIPWLITGDLFLLSHLKWFVVPKHTGPVNLHPLRSGWPKNCLGSGTYEKRMQNMGCNKQGAKKTGSGCLFSFWITMTLFFGVIARCQKVPKFDFQSQKSSQCFWFFFQWRRWS